MNRPDQFWESIDTLATAYFEGNLEKGSCRACAVGNLIRAEGKEISGGYDSWHGRLLRFRDPNDQHKKITPELPYTDEEIHQIEAAFERNVFVEYNDGKPQLDHFSGLIAVVDVLFDIHEVEDEDLRGQAKAALTDQEYDTVDAVLA